MRIADVKARKRSETKPDRVVHGPAVDRKAVTSRSRRYGSSSRRWSVLRCLATSLRISSVSEMRQKQILPATQLCASIA